MRKIFLFLMVIGFIYSGYVVSENTVDYVNNGSIYINPKMNNPPNTGNSNSIKNANPNITINPNTTPNTAPNDASNVGNTEPIGTDGGGGNGPVH